MILTENKTTQFEGLISLYHLLITAEDSTDEDKLKMGKLMLEHEGISAQEYHNHIEKISGSSRNKILKDCIAALNKCDYGWKVKSIAWMSMVANSNGFMAPKEWQLIHQVYSEELKLELSDILDAHKQLPQE